MSNEHFIPAQPGYRAWSLVEGGNGTCFATFSGFVTAWHMVPDVDATTGERAFVARPVLIATRDSTLVVEHGGIVFDTNFNDNTWPSFESWLRSQYALVSWRDADLARRLYGITDDLIEAEPNKGDSHAS